MMMNNVNIKRLQKHPFFYNMNLLLMSIFFISSVSLLSLNQLQFCAQSAPMISILYIYTQAIVSTHKSLSQSAKFYISILNIPTERYFLSNKSITLGPPMIYYVVIKPDSNIVSKNSKITEKNCTK